MPVRTMCERIMSRYAHDFVVNVDLKNPSPARNLMTPRAALPLSPAAAKSGCPK